MGDVCQKKQTVSLIKADAYEVSYKIQQDQENSINYDNTYQTATRADVEYNGLTNPYEIKVSFWKKQ